MCDRRESVTEREGSVERREARVSVLQRAGVGNGCLTDTFPSYTEDAAACCRTG